MFTSVENFFELQTNLVDPQNPDMDYPEIISEEASRVLLDWPDFHYNLTLRLQEMHYYGAGAVFFPNEYTWKSEAILASNILFPAKTRSSIGSVKQVAIRDEKDAVWFLDRIEHEEDATDAGWNVEEVKKMLIKHFSGEADAHQTEKYLSSEWESIQTRIRTGAELSEEAREFEPIRFANLLIEEADSDPGVTHIMVVEKDDQLDWLYYGDRRFEGMHKALHMMLFNIGNSYLNSVRGLAYELYSSTDIQNRLTNATLDGSLLASGLLVRGNTHDGNQKMSTVVRRGPVTFIPAGLEPVQSSFAPPISQLIESLRMVDGIQNNQSGVYKNNSEFFRGGGERSATEVSVEAQNEARFEGSQSAWYYIQWELWLKETLSRLMAKDYPAGTDGYEEAKAFRERCRDRGVPDAWMDMSAYVRVKARRAIGGGSPQERRQLTQWLLSVSPRLDEAGQQNAFRDAIGARFGYHAVDRYLPMQSRNQIVTSEHSIARLENNDMMEGSPVVVGTDQPHVIHTTRHIQYAIENIVQPHLQGQVQVSRKIVTALSMFIQHAAEHLNALGQDPTRKGTVDAFKEPLLQLIQLLQEMNSTVETIEKLTAQAQQRQQEIVENADEQGLSEESRIELLRIQANERVEMEKAKSLDRVRAAKTETQITTAVQRAIADQQRKDFESIRTIERKDAESMSNVARG